MPQRNIRRYLAAALAFALLLSACAQGAPATQTQFALGTVCRVSVYGPPRDAAVKAVFDRLREIEERMSAQKADSEISRVSAKAGLEPVAVSEDTYYVVKTALDYARRSGGAFDPSIGPLVKLWGIGTEDARVPAADEIKAALALVDYRRVRTDDATRTVYLERSGMALDLGAIAKGYAADEAAAILKAAGVSRAIIDLGGNVYALGEKAKGKPFRVGIQDPRAERNAYLGIISMSDRTLVTSGPYERFFIQDGKRYHHILDTRTGYPAESGLQSATIISRSSIQADALSTSVFAMGREGGEALLKTLPEVSAILVSDAGTITLIGPESAGFEATGAAGYALEE